MNEFHIVNITPERITVEPAAGVHIRRVCDAAAGLADDTGKTVYFKFNDTAVEVPPGLSGERAEAHWRKAVERSAEDYRKSPEGRRAARADAREIKEYQRQTDRLIEQLPDALADLDDLGSLVRWCCELSRWGDRRGVRFDPQQIADALEEAGYERNAHVGKEPSLFDDNSRMHGEYLLGQAIDCLRNGMAPHPMLLTFAERAGFLPTLKEEP